MKQVLKIDFHIFSTLLFRGWNIIAGGVLLLGIPHWFTPTEQGFYFTFASLVGLQVFFELGFNYVIIQFVGHEAANLQTDLDGFLIGNEKNIERLGSLTVQVANIFKILALLFVIIIAPSGFIFLSSNQASGPSGWVIGWLLLVTFGGINLFLSPFLAIIEGLGMVGQVARLRLIQSIIGYSLLWIFLECGAGLLSVPILFIVCSISTGLWLKYNAKPILQLLNRNIDEKHTVSFSKEIFPFQWKIALSWISGYFIFQIFNPIIFMNQGPIEAGQIGISLSIFGTILSLSMSWINSKVPSFAQYIANNDRRMLNQLFFDLFLRSCVFNLLISLFFISSFVVLRYYDFKISYRISDIGILSCLMVVCLANHIIFSIAVYVRAHKEEPLLMQSIVVAVLVFVAVYFGSGISSLAAIFLYMFIITFVALPWALIVFNKFYCKS